jgi:hypothetical protein
MSRCGIGPRKPLEHIHDFGLEPQHVSVAKQQVFLGVQAERTRRRYRLIPLPLPTRVDAPRI